MPRDGPTTDELREMAALLPRGLRDLVSLRGRHFKALGLDIETVSEGELLAMLVEDPLCLRRPILWLKDRIVAGYQAEAYRQLG